MRTGSGQNSRRNPVAVGGPTYIRLDCDADTHTGIPSSGLESLVVWQVEDATRITNRARRDESLFAAFGFGFGFGFDAAAQAAIAEGGHTLHPTSRERIAAWFVDTDYDNRCFCICQAFFPDRKKWDRLARALGDKGVVDEGRFDELTGFVTLPFARPPTLPPGKPWRVAVKVIDPRGNEGLRVLTMPEAG